MATKGYTITKKQGGLRSGLMFYADGNTRDGMVDMVSGAPGLIAGTGGSMVVRPETRGWAFTQGAGDSGLIFNTPVMERLKREDGISALLWGNLNPDDTPLVACYLDGSGHKIIMSVAGGDGALAIAGQGRFTAVGGFNLGGIHQYLATWKLGGDTRFYKDGGLFDVNATANTTPIGEVGNVVMIGNSSPGLSEFGGGGTYFGAAIWNRELRADEVLHLANDPLVLRRLCWRKRITNY